MLRDVSQFPTPFMAHFYKMHILGNDHIVFEKPAIIRAVDAQKLMDRYYGIGSDQLMVPQHPLSLFNQQDVHIDVWNADGSSADFCGNGAACVAYLLSLSPFYIQGQAIRFSLGNLNVTAFSHPDHDHTLELRLPFGQVDNAYHLDLPQPWGARWVNRVTTGNYHTVIALNPWEATQWKALAEAAFNRIEPSTNIVCWWLTTSDTHPHPQYHIRVWERGVGPTKACGSGALALASFLNQRGSLPSIFFDLCFSQGSLAIHIYEDGMIGLGTHPKISYHGEVSINK